MKEITGAVLNFGNNRIGLQLRDHRDGLEFSGLVSFFGGLVETGEDYKQGMFREIEEELGLKADEIESKFIGSFHYKDRYEKPAVMHVFILSKIDFSRLKIMEGHLCITDISNGIGEIRLVEALRPMLLKVIEDIKS